MPGITLNTTFSNAALPSSLPLGEQIENAPSLLGWFQSDANHATLSAAEILTMVDRAGGAGVLTSLGATQRADLVSGAIGSYSAARFNGTTAADGAVDLYSLSGVAVPIDAAYSYVAIFKAADIAGGDTICGRFTDASNRSILLIPPGVSELRFNHGTSASLVHPITVGEWSIVIASFDGANLNLYGDGFTYAPVAAAGLTGSGGFYVGALNVGGAQAFDGDLADLILFNSDIFADAALMQAVKDYARLVYGLVA